VAIDFAPCAGANMPMSPSKLLNGSHLSIVLNEHFDEDGEIVFREAYNLDCEGIVSKRLGSTYRCGRSRIGSTSKSESASDEGDYLGENKEKGALTRIMNEGPRFFEGKNLNSAGLRGNNFTRVRNQAGHPTC
jgi:hypothetical protein